MMNQASIRYGLIAGVGVVAYFLLFYLIKPSLILNPYIWWGSVVIYFWAMFQAAKKEGEENSFFTYLKPAFAVYVLANAFFYTFYYCLFGVFDTSLVDLQFELMQANPRAPENLKREMLDVTFNSVFFSYCSSLIAGFLYALGISFMARRAKLATI
ncbi:MAG: DUF4199 family protein [Saprospiraceae bacterium]|nr:DUF4199 family protein [Saprospiraceae bacterium]